MTHDKTTGLDPNVMGADGMREQFEHWLTGGDNYPHLKYKNFGGSYLNDESCMKWDGFKAGYKAALQSKREVE